MFFSLYVQTAKLFPFYGNRKNLPFDKKFDGHKNARKDKLSYSFNMYLSLII
jgi:hypothetical protein